MKALLVAVLIIGSGCLTVEMTPAAESFGLLPGATVVYHAETERSDVSTSYSFLFNAASVYDMYGNPLQGWAVTVSNDDGYDFPFLWYMSASYADDEPRHETWWMDGCGEPVAKRQGELTRWPPMDATGAPPMVAASLAEPVHDLELVVAGQMWTMDNRAEPPATVIQGRPDSVSVVHTRGTVTVGSGTPPTCDETPRPLPTIINTTTAWDGFAPALDPPLADALAAAKSTPTARNGPAFFQSHPDATAQRLWYDPDGGVLGGSGGAWNILWSDGATDVLVSTCSRDGQSVPGVLDDVICTDRTATWDEPIMAPAAFEMADPAELVPKAFAVHGVESCDLTWQWTDGMAPGWELFACTAPYSNDLESDATTPWLRIDASTGAFVYRYS